MKKLLTLTLIAASLLFNGCGIIPKKVEFFQDKVQKFPELTTRQKEHQKEAALAAKVSAQETLTAAEECGITNVIAPATDTAKLTDVVSEVLGPPAKPSTLTTDEIVQEVRGELAKQDRKIEAFKQYNNKDAGKKIEGTGWLQIPYFVYVGLIAFVLIIAWHLAHTVLTGLQAAGVANPIVGVAGGVGSAVMSGAESLASKAFTQTIQGVENFKNWVESEIPDAALKQKILSALTVSHASAQDQDVQKAAQVIASTVPKTTLKVTSGHVVTYGIL